MFVPIVFHNLEGYDSHLFVKSLGLTEAILIVFLKQTKNTNGNIQRCEINQTEM